MIAAVIVVGVLIGTISALAPLGPVTLMVLRRALRGESRGAMAVGLGRILPEVVYSGLATFGMAALLEGIPRVRMAIEFIGALILIVVGAVFVAIDHKVDKPREEGARSRSDFGAGFIVSALNPTLLVSWSVIVALAMGVSGIEPTLAQKFVFPFSLGGGIAIGYLILVWTVTRWGANLEERVVELVLKSMGAVLIGLGVWHAIAMARGL